MTAVWSLGLKLAPAAVVGFTSVAGSFDQGGAYVAANSIDANTSTGWGVFGGQFSPQTGVFTASAPITTGQIDFLLQNRFGSDHYLQEFRISTTTDAVPALGGSWTPVSASALRSTNGTTISEIGGGYARVTGAATGGIADAKWTAMGSFAGVTGFLLEMNPYDYDTGDGNPASLGRASNGNLVLSEFRVTTEGTAYGSMNWALSQPVGFYDAAGTPINAYVSQLASSMTDGNINSFAHPVGPSNDGYYAQVDLGAEIYIDSISMTGRLDSTCCDNRLQDYTIKFFAADGVTEVHSMFHAGQTKLTESIDVSGDYGGIGPQAQFVRVINSSQAAYGPQIGELAVFGVIPEPSSAVLVGLGISLLFPRRRKRI